MRPAYSIVFSAQVNGATDPLAVGDVVIPSASDPAVYVLATAANRGTRRAEAIVLTPYGGTGIGAIELLQVGPVDASVIPYLGAGTVSLVRVSSAGRLERVTSPGLSDDICGLAEADGRVHLFFGLPAQFVQSIVLAYSAGLTTFLSRQLSPGLGGAMLSVIAFVGDTMGITFPTLSLTADDMTLDCSDTLLMRAGGVDAHLFASSMSQSALPRVGLNSVYASDGRATMSMADANQVAPSSVYSRAIIRTIGALTANRTLTLPHPSTDFRSYTKVIDNECSGVGSLVVATGTGTTVTLTPGKYILMFTPDGVETVN